MKEQPAAIYTAPWINVPNGVYTLQRTREVCFAVKVANNQHGDQMVIFLETRRQPIKLENLLDSDVLMLYARRGSIIA